jgi:phenylacetate-CoA ligase
MLLADRAQTRRLLTLAEDHERLVQAADAGLLDVAAHWAARLEELLASARRSALYAGWEQSRWDAVLGGLRAGSPQEALATYARHCPPLGKPEVRAAGLRALTQPLHETVQYFESSGSTGDATPAPKAWPDYLCNTINIGRGWRDRLSAESVALMLINAPFAPAPFQFQRVLEYLGVTFLRPWVDNVSGDYRRILRLMHELQVDAFIGPPSRLLQLLEAERASTGPSIRLSVLLLMAEQCGPSFCEHLRELTGAEPLVAAYGASETGTIAVGCGMGRMHVQTQSFIVEVAAGDEPPRPLTEVREPLSGELVVTTLDLALRPLLRFRTGDHVTVKPSTCACGRRTPELVTHGRSADRLVFGELQVTQEEVERVLWREPGDHPAALNYMIVVHSRMASCLVTRRPEASAAAYAAMEERLGALCPAVRWQVRAVDRLPAVASLGQFLGWKMSRVLDARDTSALERLPDFVRELVEDGLAAGR